MHRGYVKLWRKSIDSGLLQNAEAWQLMTWCLLKATHKPHKQLVGKQIVILEAGQFIFGRKKAASDLKSSEQKIRTSLKLLQDIGFLTIKSTNKYSVIKVNNWDIYQVEDAKDNQQATSNLTNKQPTSNQQATTNKNEEEHKNEEEYYITRKKRKLTGKRLEWFERFWRTFDYKKGKAEAADSWYEIPQLTDMLCEQIVSAAASEARRREQLKLQGRTPKMAQGWLAGRRWEDEVQEQATLIDDINKYL